MKNEPQACIEVETKHVFYEAMRCLKLHKKFNWNNILKIIIFKFENVEQFQALFVGSNAHVNNLYQHYQIECNQIWFQRFEIFFIYIIKLYLLIFQICLSSLSFAFTSGFVTLSIGFTSRFVTFEFDEEFDNSSISASVATLALGL